MRSAHTPATTAQHVCAQRDMAEIGQLERISVVTNDNPLVWAPRAEYVLAGTRIIDTMPKNKGRLLCRLDGVYVSRRDWHRRMLPGSVVEWVQLVDDFIGDALRPLLQIGVAIASVYIAINFGPWFAVGFNIAASLAINALLPVQQQKPQENPATIYTTSLSGNTEDLNGPVPKICGRHKIFPRFAAKPYFEFKNDLNPDGDQYYYALFAIGVGNHDLEEVYIDDSPIGSFRDVLTAVYLAPGEQPTVVQGNVITSQEVSSMEMKTNEYVGGFIACDALFTTTKLGIDFSAPRGLSDKTVSWRVEVQEVNQFGIPQSAWVTVGTGSEHADTVNPQRWSFLYYLPYDMRPKVRVIRTDTEDTSSGALHKLEWTSMRAYLTQPAFLNANVAHYEVVMRASQQLNQLTQKRLNMVVRAKVRTWDPVYGWQDEVHTRNPMWWLADLWTNTIWGEGLGDDRVDLQTLYEMAQLAEERYDHFDYVFDSTVDAWEAAQLIARTLRCRVFRREGVYTLSRDGAVTAPRTAFSPRNTVAKSMTISETLLTKDSPDGVILEYFDYRQWDWVQIECPCPGIPFMHYPITIRLPGITGAVHAEREGLYEAAQLLYRNRTVTCTTEMQGLLPSVLTPVKWQPEIVGYGQTGDVIGWDESQLLATLSEPLAFVGSVANYIVFIRDDGTLTDPVEPVVATDAYSVYLPSAPDFDFIVDDGTRERPKFIFGTATSQSEIVKISEVADGGKGNNGAQLFKLTGIVDDERIHEVDAHLLNLGYDPDEIPLISPSGTDGDPTGLTPNLAAVKVQGGSTNGDPASISVTFKNDGSLRGYFIQSLFGHSGAGYPNVWLLTAPDHVFTTGQTGLFEVRATYIDDDFDTNLAPPPDESFAGTGQVFSGTLNTWLNLATDRTWSLSLTSGRATCWVRYEIRDAATQTIQAEATFNFYAFAEDIDAGVGGGGP